MGGLVLMGGLGLKKLKRLPILLNVTEKTATFNEYTQSTR